MRVVRGFGRFWYEFLVGDDWRIALGVLAVLAGGAVAARSGAVADAVIVGVGAAAIGAVVVLSILAGVRRSARGSAAAGEDR